MLIHHLGRIGDEARGVVARYLSDCLAAIEEVLGQNDNVFCNEQFNDKYNVLLLQNVINLSERLKNPVARSALHDHGINRPKLLGFVDRLLPKIFTRAALRSVTDETEYLLYLSDYVALRARAAETDAVWRMLENLLDELLERYRDGRGVTASREQQKTFNFHVPLTVAVYERLLGVERP